MPRSSNHGLLLWLPIVASLTLVVFTATIVSAAGPSERTSTADYYTHDDQLRSLVAILLEENPGIRAAWSESRSRYQRVDQAASLPDPMIAYRYFVESPETRVGPQEHALEISQGVPWNSKRRLQGEQARSLADGTTWQAANRERAQVAVLKKTYMEAAYLQEAIIVLTEERSLLERFEKIALTRYSTGKGIQQSVIKVQTEISRLDEKEFALNERLDVIRQRISDLIGRPGTDLVLTPITLPFLEVAIDSTELEELAAEQHPTVRVVESRIEADQTWTRRRTLDRKPDFKVGLGYTLVGGRNDPAGILSPPPDNGNDILGVTFGVTIPLYRKRIRAGIAEAEQAVVRDQQTITAVRNNLRFRVQQAITRMQSTGERGRMYSTVIIPQAEQALGSAEAAYSANRLGFLDLLDAERILFQARLAFHRLISDYWIAAAELEEAINRPFPSMTEEPSR